MTRPAQRTPTVFALALSLLAPLSGFAQSSLDSLADATARATVRYTDRRAAVTDGYRRLGTDFPGMGEHWLQANALLNGSIDAARPTLLTYANINGKATLLGIGFVVVTRGSARPTGVPGWPDVWHEHSGLLADESGVAPSRAGSDTHAWVLHVWTVLENPAGRYTPDNWTLPFARSGMIAPAGLDADVGRAFSLVVGGDAYLSKVLIDAGIATPARRATIDSAIAVARARAVAVAERVQRTRSVAPTDVMELREVWRALGASLRAVGGPAVDPFLAPPHAHHARH